MTIDTLLKFFIPRNDVFYPLFDRDTVHLVSTAEQLKALVIASQPEERFGMIAKIRELKKEGNEVALLTYRELENSFITPFEREDIHRFSNSLDGVFKSIDFVSQSIRYYNPAELKYVYYELAESIYEITLELGICINYLKDAGARKLEIFTSLKDLTALRDKSRKIYLSGIADVIEKEKNITEMIKHKSILENFEKCIDRTSGLLVALKAILIKIL